MDFELKYYNQNEVWNNYVNNSKEIRRAEEILRYIPGDVSSILDIGCGNGIVTNMINKECVIGMDFAITPLKNVKKSAVCGSIHSLPFKENMLDLILMTEVLEHLNDKIYKKAIKEINRLKPKYLMISVPFDENLEEGLCKCGSCGTLFNVAHHYRSFNEKWYSNEFPDYKVQFANYSSHITPQNRYILKLMHFCGAYNGFQYAVCPECGNKPVAPQVLLKYTLTGINYIDKAVKKVFRIQKPYHQVILLKRQ